MHFFMEPSELFKLIDEKNVFIADCRSDLMDLEFGRKSYLEGHIKNSVFIDGESILHGAHKGLKKHGGRHPMPDLMWFKKEIEKLGISSKSKVIAHGLYAARLIFMLNMLGIEDAFILNGNIDTWKNSGYKLTRKIVKKEAGNITPKLKENLVVNMDYVKEKMNNKGTVIVDSRSEERHKGIKEPIDKIAGCIPNSLNIFWKSHFDEESRLKPLDRVKQNFDPLIKSEPKEIILHCGSGITAAYNYLVLKELGISSKIYAGSWSDWISYPENPIA